MSLFDSPRFLRHVLVADAVSCLACGGLQLVGGQALATLLGLPSLLLSATGAFLLAWGAIVAGLALPAALPRGLVGAIAAGNLAWAVGCGALLAFGGVQPTALGWAWVVAQALTVVVLAELQWTSLRRQVLAGWA